MILLTGGRGKIKLQTIAHSPVGYGLEAGLLDEMALRFVESGWNVKQLVRAIVVSKTYRQSSDARPEEFAADPENRLLARGSRYRMDAEMIRDQILFVSGKLNQKMYGTLKVRFSRARNKADQSPYESIESGKELYAGYCAGCHGSNAAARFGSSVPDLRFATAETHATWQAIVIGGSKSANGMPGMEIPLEDSEAIRNYVLSQSEALRATQESR